ncbi:hypothetical protein CC86DRAFT_101120 [Ophiobolus disseminans]|uniref:RING-type domain-containing protein n=1 Tax=Ophiobolus disseminans TaxID=1469910 RepID=A0A6A6ZMD4_9PLEO|nr:hypothetical protein CC86DRAFT_101120 [Ophiobolus disseminans]
MPALSSYDALMQLERREWKQTVGQSGMTPTAFAFLIPVFVVVVFCPFLCVFCIRKRQRAIPPVKPVKKPALRRAEARERLRQVTDVSDVTDASKAPQHEGTVEERDQAQVNAESSSILERECAICLSTLHAPSPPEPALIQSQPTIDEAALRPQTPSPTSTNPDPSAPEAILKLQACGHEFHSECLVSWFVLRKTTCPICRAPYISKEDMKLYEDEEAAIGAAEAAPVVEPPPTGARTDANGVPISNWRYFWRGENWHSGRARDARSIAGNSNGASGNPVGQPDAVEMARWTYFARTRR